MNRSEKIIVALDLPSEQQALAAVHNLLPEVSYVKVGMELFYATGPALIGKLKDLGLKVFVDLKIHDIPNTAFGAINSLSRLGCDLLNLHCAGGVAMMSRAREAVVGNTKLIGVTQLTSTDQRVLNQELGIPGTIEDSVMHYASLARQAGLHGVVCSPLEVAKIKQSFGADFITVTPGVRPASTNTQDQKRVMTPGEAIKVGSDYLVIGRPILTNSNPKQAFIDILKEIEVVS